MPVEYNRMVETRDGVRLATDVYYPEGGAACGDAILLRTPYGKLRTAENSRFSKLLQMFREAGFVVVIQDCRGRWQSEGEFFPLEKDGDDGCDTLDWIERESWSNGRVGTYGCSYLGENQIVLAARRHRAHRAAIAESAGGALGHWNGLRCNFGLFENGVLALGAAFSWASGFGSRYMPRLLVERLSAEEYVDLERRAYRNMDLPAAEAARALWRLPAIDMMRACGAHAGASLFEFCIAHEVSDPAWARLNLVDETCRFDVPTLHVNGWYDYGVAATIALREMMTRNAASDRARDGQHLIIFPSGHCAWSRGEASEPMQVGAWRIDSGNWREPGGYAQCCLQWFRWRLRDEAPAVAPAPVSVHVGGADRWARLQSYPPQSSDCRLYLGSKAAANSRLGDGVLSDVVDVEGCDHFIADPNNPAPSLGGDMPSLSMSAPDGCFLDGPQDQSSIELRADVLVYTSDLLAEDITIVGAPSVELYVSSSAPDTDFCVKLLRVDPDERSWNLAETVIRCRYRNGYDSRALLREGEIARVTASFHDIAQRISAGCRLRLDIAGGSFPRYARNMHTGELDQNAAQCRAAKNSVYFGADYPSRLTLPIVANDFDEK